MTWVLVPQEYSLVGFGLSESRTTWSLLVVADDATARPVATFNDEPTARRCVELLRREGMVDTPLSLADGATS